MANNKYYILTGMGIDVGYVFRTQEEAEKLEAEWKKDDEKEIGEITEYYIKEVDTLDDLSGIALVGNFAIQDKETGTYIDSFKTLEEAEKQLAIYEEMDKKDGLYTEDFYEIVLIDKRHFYAVQRNKDDNDWGTGSFDFNEAVKICKSNNYEIIAEIELGNDPVCVKEFYNGIDF